MRCVRCGAPLDPDLERCVRCGEVSAAVASAPPLPPNAEGIPIQRFLPAASGAPVALEPYLRPGRVGAERSSRAAGGLRIVLPAPARRRRMRRSLVGFTALIALLVLAGLAGGIIVRGAGGGVQIGPLTIGGPPPAPPAPTAPPARPCLVQPADPTASLALADAQMTTGVRDPQAQDFRPVDDVTAFRAGQRAYITFRIVAARAGVVTVSFCTRAGTIPGTLDVPAGAAHLYGQFSVALGPAHVGPAVATLRWDGATAASIPFTVGA